MSYKFKIIMNLKKFFRLLKHKYFKVLNISKYYYIHNKLIYFITIMVLSNA